MNCTDNMRPVNVFAVIELSVVLVVLCGNLCCAFLHPYRYIRMGYKVDIQSTYFISRGAKRCHNRERKRQREQNDIPHGDPGGAMR